jgi:hypothetical protein
MNWAALAWRAASLICMNMIRGSMILSIASSRLAWGLLYAMFSAMVPENMAGSWLTTPICRHQRHGWRGGRANLVPKPRRVKLADVHIINKNTPGIRIVEAKQQRRNSAFPTDRVRRREEDQTLAPAAPSHNGLRATLADRQREVFQHGCVLHLVSVRK